MALLNKSFECETKTSLMKNTWNGMSRWQRDRWRRRMVCKGMPRVNKVQSVEKMASDPNNISIYIRIGNAVWWYWELLATAILQYICEMMTFDHVHVKRKLHDCVSRRKYDETLVSYVGKDDSHLFMSMWEETKRQIVNINARRFVGFIFLFASFFFFVFKEILPIQE